MTIKGTFYNEAKKITISINGDNTYSLSGLKGYDNDRGEFWISDRLDVAGYPYTFSLKRVENQLNISTVHIPVKLINVDTFSTIYNDFCNEDFNGLVQPAIFKRLK